MPRALASDAVRLARAPKLFEGFTTPLSLALLLCTGVACGEDPPPSDTYSGGDASDGVGTSDAGAAGNERDADAPDANKDPDSGNATITLSTLKAFPTAMGAGMFITGGRGGKTFFVNTREDLPSTDPGYGSYDAATDTYSGTLRYCLVENNKIAKNIVFLVGGEFSLLRSDIRVNKQAGGNISILGQTARDLGGVHITGSEFIVVFDNLKNLNIRFVDFKPGLAFTDRPFTVNPGVSVRIDGATYPIVDNRFTANGRSYWVEGNNLVREADGMNVTRSYDIMIDHVTAGWHGDESLSVVYFNNDGKPFQNVTVQRTLFLPGLRGHNVGGLFGSNASASQQDAAKVENGDMHHNCFVNLTHRFPNIGGGPSARFRVFNNVIYGWGSRIMNLFGDGPQDVFNNYYRRSPATVAPSARDGERMFKFDFLYDPSGSLAPSVYVAGNFVDRFIETPDGDNWSMLSHFRDTARGSALAPLSRDYQRTSPIVDAEHPIEFDDALSTLPNVLNDVGASVVYNADGTTRYADPVDAAYLTEVQSNSGPTTRPSTETWIYPSFTNASAVRSDFDSEGVPVGWTAPSNVVNTAGYSRQELYFAEQAGDLIRLR